MMRLTDVSRHQATARISLSSLKNNLLVSREASHPSRALFIVKGGFYGHGQALVVNTIDQHLRPNDVLGVTDLESALSLRKALPHRRVLLLHGVFDVAELEQSVEARLEVVIHHGKQLELLSKQTHLPTPPIWIKVDTGMGRLGFSKKQALHYAPLIKKLQPHCLLSHFACADNPSHPLNEQQKQLFSFYKTLFTEIPYTSQANSATILNEPCSFSQNEYVRPGIMLYGFSPNPSPRNGRWEKSLKPILSLYAPIVSIKEIEKDALVGYGATWKAPENGWLATLKIGYADGYPRALSNHQNDAPYVYLKGEKLLIVGRISMDLLTIYIPSKRFSNKKIQIGELVELWGENISLYELAEKAQTIPYELLTRLSSRVRRVVENGHDSTVAV